MKQLWRYLPETVASLSASILILYVLVPPRAVIALQACGRFIYWIALELLPFSLVLPILALWLLNAILGWTLTSLGGESYAPYHPRQDLADHPAAYATTVLTIAGFGILIAASAGFPIDAWLPLGGWAWLLVWAALFAPWFVLRHWTLHQAGWSSPVRAVLIVLAFGFVAGWLYCLSPWLTGL